MNARMNAVKTREREKGERECSRSVLPRHGRKSDKGEGVLGHNGPDDVAQNDFTRILNLDRAELFRHRLSLFPPSTKGTSE